MYQKKRLFYALFLYLMIGSSYAENFDISISNDPHQTAINASSAISDDALRANLAKNKKVVPQTLQESSRLAAITKELENNQALLEQVFLNALVYPQPEVLPLYIELYQKSPNFDLSLIEWANAILLRQNDIAGAETLYTKLSESFPDNNFIRFQLADTLFYNLDYAAAKLEFQQLKKSPQFTAEEVAIFDIYLNAIEQREKWNFSFGGSFLNDKNLSNAAPQGTTITLPTGNTLTYSSERQEGQGISTWLGADKKWYFLGGKYLAFDSSLSSKYYWNNKKYNDFNAHLGLGFGYANAKFDLNFIPYIDKRWYAGGFNSGNSLKQYTNTYGANLSTSYWLKNNLKYSFAYDFGYEKYDDISYSNQYNGPSHSMVNSLFYLPSDTQYWLVALDLNKKDAKDRANAYDRVGARLTWGQQWPYDFSTSTTLGFGSRDYKEKTFFGPKQKNKEYSASLSLWNNKINVAGFTPKLTFNYTKTDSNIAIYSYDKKQVYLNIDKAF